MNRDWTETRDSTPPEGELVETMNSSGQVINMIRQGGLWFFEDKSMYVYYVPQRWKSL